MEISIRTTSLQTNFANSKKYNGYSKIVMTSLKATLIKRKFVGVFISSLLCIILKTNTFPINPITRNGIPV